LKKDSLTNNAKEQTSSIPEKYIITYSIKVSQSLFQTLRKHRPEDIRKILFEHLEIKK
jgi:hypothetical protein